MICLTALQVLSLTPGVPALSSESSFPAGLLLPAPLALYLNLFQTKSIPLGIITQISFRLSVPG